MSNLLFWVVFPRGTGLHWDGGAELPLTHLCPDFTWLININDTSPGPQCPPCYLHFCCPLLGATEGCAGPAGPKAPVGYKNLPDRCPNLSEIKEGQSSLGVTAAASAVSKHPSSHCAAFPGLAAHPAQQAPIPSPTVLSPGPQAPDTLQTHTEPQPRTAALQPPSPRELFPSSPHCSYCSQSLRTTN